MNMEFPQAPFFEAYPEPTSGDDWETGFEAGRSVVVRRLGPFESIYARPRNFRRRFYHTVHPLPVTDWVLDRELELYGGLGSLTASLQLRFQPTVQFVLDFPESLPDTAKHIRQQFHGLLLDVLDRIAARVEALDWLQADLSALELAAADSVNEILLLHNIQCRSRCRLKARFRSEAPELRDPATHYGSEQQIRALIQRNFSRLEQMREEMRRQAAESERSRLEHETRLLAQQRAEEELERARAAQQDALLKGKLELEEQRLRMQLESEERQVRERLAHNQRLKQLEIEARREETARQLAELEEEENRLRSQLESRRRQFAEQLEQEKQLREMQLQKEQEELERRHRSTSSTDAFLRRDIELLVLEKRRTELQEEIAQQRNSMLSRLGINFPSLTGPREPKEPKDTK